MGGGECVGFIPCSLSPGIYDVFSIDVCCVPGCFVSLCFILSSWCILLYGDRFMAVISLCNVDDLVEIFLCFTKDQCC